MSISTYAESLRAQKAKPVHLLKEVGDQWQTPPALYWGIFAKFGPFILDLFSDGDNAKCPRYYTVEDNALTQDWTKDLAGGKAYANPPYSRASYEDKQAITGMRNIIAKSIEERDKGAQFVYLIKSATSEVWWPEDADHVCFIRGRISFDLPEWFVPANKTQEASSAGFACAIAIFDKTWRGERMSYINRDDLLRDGQVMLDMIAAAAQIKVDKQAIKIIEDIKVDINEEIAKAPANSLWPIEVLDIAKEVFALCGIEKPTEIQFQELCEEANRQRLEGNSTDSIIDDLVMNMPTEAKTCAA